MNEILKNRLNEILNFATNMTFHPVHTYLLRMRDYQFCLRSRWQLLQANYQIIETPCIKKHKRIREIVPFGDLI